MRKVYLDYAATTPVDPTVLEAMLPYFSDKFGNSSSIHSWGREAASAVQESRKTFAGFLHCTPEEVFFTGSTTESENLALVGVVSTLMDANPQKSPADFHLVTSPIEHHGSIKVFKRLEGQGFKVTYLPVDKYGLVKVEDVVTALENGADLVNIMYVNNEVGTIQPIAEVGKAIQEFNTKDNRQVVFHTDAAQGVGYVDLDVKKLNVDLVSLGAHKFYGPKGLGILYVKKGTSIQPMIVGGSQEKNLRAGTSNVPSIVGAGKAITLIKDSPLRGLSFLRDNLIKGVLENIPDVYLTGHPTKRSPALASFVFPGVEGEALLLMLDRAGIAASSGSACTSVDLHASHVLLAMGISAKEAHGSLRLSLGKHTTEEDIDYVVEKLPAIVEELRNRRANL